MIITGIYIKLLDNIEIDKENVLFWAAKSQFQVGELRPGHSYIGGFNRRPHTPVSPALNPLLRPCLVSLQIGLQVYF